MTPVFRVALLAALAASTIPAVAAGQEASANSLQRQIDLLERRTIDLEERVRQLEALFRAEPGQSLPGAASTKWRDLQNWRQLRMGMTMNQVRAALGEPGRVDANILETTWYWDYPRGPSVGFDSSSGRVKSWSEPRQ
jgi:hypothetical protein